MHPVPPEKVTLESLAGRTTILETTKGTEQPIRQTFDLLDLLAVLIEMVDKARTSLAVVTGSTNGTSCSSVSEYAHG